MLRGGFGGSDGDGQKPPPIRVVLGFSRFREMLGLGRASGVSAPPADKAAGGVNPLCSGVSDVGNSRDGIPLSAQVQWLLKGQWGL